MNGFYQGRKHEATYFVCYPFWETQSRDVEFEFKWVNLSFFGCKFAGCVGNSLYTLQLSGLFPSPMQ